MKLINADEAFRVLSDYYHHGTETQADALREALELVPESTLDRYIEAARHQYWEDPLVENSFMVHGGLMTIKFW